MHRLDKVKPTQRRRFVLLLAAANLGIVGGMVLAAGLALLASLRSHELRARETTESLAVDLAAEIAAELRQIDNALATVAKEARRLEPGSAAAVARIEQVLADQRSLLPQVDALRVADAAGIVRYGLAPGAASTDISDRDYFNAARRQQDLVISEPLQGRIIRKWGVILARRLEDPQGRFAGVAYTNLSTDHFIERFRQLPIGEAGAVSLRSPTLRLIARHTPREPGQQSTGSAYISADLLRELARNPQRGFYVTRATLDGIERTGAYRRVPGYPLLVVVGLGTADFLAPWRTELWQLAGLVVVVTVVVVGFSSVVWVQRMRQDRIQQELAQLAAEQNAMLDNELVGMVRLKNRQAVWKNRAMDLIFGYEPHELDAAPARLLYLDDDSFEFVGREAYPMLSRGLRFRTQLRMRRKDGSALWVDLSGAQVSPDESLWLMVDISALKDSEARAQYMAMHDPLTGLANRLQYAQRLEALLASGPPPGSVAVCLLDLDGFKPVNDRHGHDAGDLLLRELSARLLQCVRAHDIVARLGGDEFGVVLTSLRRHGEAQQAMERLLQALQQPVRLAGEEEVSIGASIGVAVYTSVEQAPATLMRCADEAMYAAKRAGKNGIAVVDAAQQAREGAA